MTPVLYHFSENPTITRFEPRLLPTNPDPVVWAVAAERAYLYLFPRDCPRVAFYAGPETSDADRERFLGFTTATEVCAIEAAWLDRMRNTTLYRYEFPLDGFDLIDECAGYWTNHAAVEPVRVEPVADLLTAHAEAGVELRILASLWPLYEAVIASSLQFSIIRWRNAAPRPDTAKLGSLT